MSEEIVELELQRACAERAEVRAAALQEHCAAVEQSLGSALESEALALGQAEARYVSLEQEQDKVWQTLRVSALQAQAGTVEFKEWAATMELMEGECKALEKERDELKQKTVCLGTEVVTLSQQLERQREIAQLAEARAGALASPADSKLRTPTRLSGRSPPPLRIRVAPSSSGGAPEVTGREVQVQDRNIAG